MTSVEEIGVRLALIGKGDYLSGLQEARKAQVDFGASAKGSGDAAKQAAVGTKAQQDALRSVTAAADKAVESQRAYEQALAANADPAAAAAAAESQLAEAQARVAETSAAAREATAGLSAANSNLAAANHELALADEELRLANEGGVASEREAAQAARDRAAADVDAAAAIRNKALGDSSAAAAADRSAEADLRAAEASRTAAGATEESVLATRAKRDEAVAAVGAATTAATAEETLAERTRLAGVKKITAWESFRTTVLGATPAIESSVGGVATKEAETAGAVEASNARMNASWGKMATLSKGVLVGTAVTVGVVGAATVDMAAKFDASMEQIHTQAGVPQSAIAGLKTQVLGLAGKVAQDPDSLAEAMYHVQSSFASAGMSAAESGRVLEAAAKGATIGQANLVDVTNAMDAAVVSGIPGVQNYDQAMGALNATVGAGDMKMQDLADAFGKGNLAAVKTYGVNIRDVGAALAEFGDNNLRGAAAGTQLRMSVQALEVPAKSGKKALDMLGLSQDTLAKDMQTGGLNKAVTDLHERLVKTGHAGNDMGQVLTEAFGKRAGTGINVLEDQFDRFQGKFHDIDKGANSFADAWTSTTQTFKFRMSSMEDASKATGVKIGEALLPIANSVLDGVTKGFQAIGAAIDWLGQHKAVLAGLGAVLAVIIAPAIGALVVATFLWAAATLAATWPLLAIAAGVGLVVFAIVELKDHWGTIWGWVTKVASEAWDKIKGVWGGIVGWFKGIFDGVVGFFKSWGPLILAVLVPFIGIPLEIVRHWGAIVDFFKKLPGNIAEGVGYAIGATIKFFMELPGRIERGVTDAGRWLVDTGLKAILGLAAGIISGWVSVKAWFEALPGRVAAFFTNTGLWLVETGAKILIGLEAGIMSGYVSVTAWFKALPSKVTAFFTGAPHWLESTGLDIIKGLLSGLSSAAIAVYDWVTGMVGRFMSGFAKGLGIASPSKVFIDFGVNIIKGLLLGLQNMAESVVAFFRAFAQRLAAGFKVDLQAVAAVALWLWHSVIEPVAKGIDAAFDWLVTQLQNSGTIIMTGLRVLGSIFTWLWQNAVMPVVHGIDDAFDWVQNQLAQAGQLIMTGLRLLGSIFTWLYETAVHNAVTNISNVWNWLYSNVIEPVGQAIQTAVHAIGQAFSDTVDWIKRTWQTIQDIVSVPVRFVVNTVYGKGIKPTWDAIAGVFGLPPAPAAPGFASGGIAGDDPQGSGFTRAASGRTMPGYEPGHDRFHIMVGGGESIMRPEWTRLAQRVLGPSAIERMNHEARAGRGDLIGRVAASIGNAEAMMAGPQAGGVADSPFASPFVRRFAGGGVADLPVPPIPAAGPDVSIGDSILKSFGNLFMLPKLVLDPKGYFDDLFKPFTDPLSGMGSSRFMQAMKDVPGKAIDGIVAKVKSWIASMSSGGASMGPESASHALDIVNATKAKGLHHDAAVIALMTGMQESGIRVLANPNVPASMALPHDGVGQDHDSVGIFQQRQTWGPTPLLMNPFGSAELFLNKLGGGPYGDFGAAAQRVQVSAFPGAYSKWQGQATAMAGPNFAGGGIVGAMGGRVFGLPYGGARALGGAVSPGSAYLVGESGPELVTPASTGTVVPADVTAGLAERGETPAGVAGRGGDVHFHQGAIVVQGAHDPQATAAAVAQIVSDRIARQ